MQDGGSTVAGCAEPLAYIGVIRLRHGKQQDVAVSACLLELDPSQEQLIDLAFYKEVELAMVLQQTMSGKKSTRTLTNTNVQYQTPPLVTLLPCMYVCLVTGLIILFFSLIECNYSF